MIFEGFEVMLDDVKDGWIHIHLYRKMIFIFDKEIGKYLTPDFDIISDLANKIDLVDWKAKELNLI